ncbi:mycothione reductase [soil metagenome]
MPRTASRAWSRRGLSTLTVLGLIGVWATVNLVARPFEPFPTVFLAVISAVLASLGALQGPIILRVQRRQRQRDHDRDEIAHRINLRAEIEIRYLDHKLDHLIAAQGAVSEHGVTDGKRRARRLISQRTRSMQTYDLLVLGAGSGNMLFTPELSGLRTAIVEPDRFGGTCLNRGCIPSKMLVVAAEAARTAATAGRLGVHATVNKVDWPAIRDRIFDRIDPLHDEAVAYRRSSGIDVYTEPARFVGPHEVRVGDDVLRADQIVIATGSRPVVPDIAGLDDVDHHTSDSIMRLDRLPDSMLIVGGGFIAAEMGHVFSAFGSRVHIVQRGDRMLTAADDDIAACFTAHAADRFDLHLGATVTAVERNGSGVTATIDDGGRRTLDADVLLLATGRRPNTDVLDVAAAGLDTDEHGHLVTDGANRTNVPGVWALGDAANHFQLKHMANAEMRVVAHNLAQPDNLRHLEPGPFPHAVFTEPQIAAIGMTQAEAQQRGIAHVVATRRYADTAYGWALEDTTSFVKLIADAHYRTLLGAHIIGPDAAILLHPLVQGMMLGQTVDRMARDVIYIHPALTEVIEQALLGL